MQINKDTEQEKNKVVLHAEKEVALLRFDIASEFVLLIYRNLAAHWWWDGLDIKAQVEQDLTNPDQYNLHQTEESAEYDPFKSLLKPHRLGYIVITRVDKDIAKPIDVKLVCCWSTVLSFWEDLESNLEKEFPIIEEKHTVTESKEVVKIEQTREIYVPKRFADLNRWKELYKQIRGWSGMSANAISQKLRNNNSFPNLPNSPDTIASVIRAGKAGLLD